MALQVLLLVQKRGLRLVVVVVTATVMILILDLMITHTRLDLMITHTRCHCNLQQIPVKNLITIVTSLIQWRNLEMIVMVVQI